MAKVEISDHDLFELSTLVYKRWAEEYDLLKKVKAETDDGTDPDYELMHETRLGNHAQKEAYWKAFLKRMTDIRPKLI